MRLQAQGLGVRLSGRDVLRDASLSADAGAVVAVLGPNGAGKSTLLRALAGLVAPHAGRVLLDRADLAALDRSAVGRRIAFLPQDRTIHWPLTVASVVALGRRPHGAGFLARPGDRAACERALAAMDLVELAGRPMTELSGGERARALIARALAQETDVLIADEPLAGLDPAHQLQLADRLAALAAGGRTVLVSLHDLSLAMRMASSVVLLKAGSIVAAGPISSELTAQTIAAVFGIRARIETIEDRPHVVPLDVLC